MILAYGTGGAERGVHSFMPCVGNITATVIFHVCLFSVSFCTLTHTYTHTAAAMCVSLSHTHSLCVAKPLHVHVGQSVNGWGYFGTHTQPLQFCDILQ